MSVCVCLCLCVSVSLLSNCVYICMSVGLVPDTHKYYTIQYKNNNRPMGCEAQLA